MPNPARPHRRLSLTLPSTAPAATETPEAVQTPVAPIQESTPLPQPATQSIAEAPVVALSTNQVVTKEEVAELETVRVMAYLTSDEAQILDELWLLMRRKHGKVSKSDILRASLTLAFEKQNDLSSAMSEQQVNTSSRQRSSKIVRR